jgi:hypothetical protein
MAYEYLILTNQPNSLSTRYVQAYLKNTLVPGEVRLADESIALNAPLSSIDLAAAWTRGTVVPNGLFLWNQLRLEEKDEIARVGIGAFFDVIRANGTLAQMVTALEGALDDDAEHLVAYNRISAALIAGTNAQRMNFIAALAVFAYSKIGQRQK